MNRGKQNPIADRIPTVTTRIRYGTSGRHALMAEEFTSANVWGAVTGMARYAVSQKPKGAKVIMERDPRLLGETFLLERRGNPFGTRHHAPG